MHLPATTINTPHPSCSTAHPAAAALVTHLQATAAAVARTTTQVDLADAPSFAALASSASVITLEAFCVPAYFTQTARDALGFYSARGACFNT